ncbi:MAG: hypothetical protein ACRDVP_09270, partial [Acidimicrobiales bacterium]
ELVVAREIPAAGRSRCWVNGKMATVSSLAELGHGLAEIQGQGDQQALVQPVAQRRSLDAFAHIDTSVVSHLLAALGDLDRRIEVLGGDRRRRDDERELLTYQLAEIDASGLEDPGEDGRLEHEESTLADLASHRERALSALGSLDPDGGGPGSIELLGAAASAIEAKAGLRELASRIRAAHSEVVDIASELRNVVEGWEDDPERLEEVQARRRRLRDLYRLYGGDRVSVLEFARNAGRRLERLDLDGAQAHELEIQRAAVRTELDAARGSVLAQREAAGPLLARAVESALERLAMAGSVFRVDVGSNPAKDDVTFMFGEHGSDGLRPLAKTASGGELARTMLALFLVAPEGPPTMVFDEVDAGVGGAAALALAEALAQVAASRQVLVVTHLAQVAAFGGAQISLTKSAGMGRRRTAAKVLNGEDRVVEIARMLSGHPRSARAHAHAAELLELAASALGARAGRS